MSKEGKKINLGGGADNIEGYLNIDRVELPTVDIVADLESGIPLEPNSVAEVRAVNILEHLSNTVFIMEEIHRVCKPNARVVIKVPYFKSTAAFKDPTHCSFFSERTFEYFDRTNIEDGTLPEYKIKANFHIENITYNYYTRGTRFLPFAGILRRFLWDIVKTIVVELRVKK